MLKSAVDTLVYQPAQIEYILGNGKGVGDVFLDQLDIFNTLLLKFTVILY